MTVPIREKDEITTSPDDRWLSEGRESLRYSAYVHYMYVREKKTENKIKTNVQIADPLVPIINKTTFLRREKW